MCPGRRLGQGRRTGRTAVWASSEGLGRVISGMAIISHLAFGGISSKGRVAFATVVRPVSTAPVWSATPDRPSRFFFLAESPGPLRALILFFWEVQACTAVAF